MNDKTVTITRKKKSSSGRNFTISSLPGGQKKQKKDKITANKIFSHWSSPKSLTFKLFKTKVKLEELYVFTSQFAELLSAGVPLISGLTIMAHQTENKHFKIVIEKVREDVNAGATLMQAMSKFPNVFSKLYIALVWAAESSGTLVKVFQQLAFYLQQQDQLNKMLKAAVVYPKFVSMFFLAVLMGIIFALIPKFQEIFASFNAELPLPTRILINISHFAKNHLIMEALIVITIVVLFKQFKKTSLGIHFLDKLKLNLPLVSEIIIKAALSKFCRTLSVLIQSGVSVVQALEIAAETVQNIHINNALRKVKRGIIEGTSLNYNLNRNPIFPILMVKMISVGEESGSLDKMLIKVSEIYDSFIDSKVKGLSTIIEPALMMLLGAVALVVIIALYLPIFKIGSVIQ